MQAIKAYYRAEDVEEALRLLSRSEVNTAFLAGGTTLLIQPDGGIDEVVDLQELGLDQIEMSEDQIFVGSMVRIQAIVDHTEVAPLIREMARREGPNTMRHAGTIGGLVVQADRESELYAALLVHRASVRIQTLAGEKVVNLDTLSPKILTGGLITAITLAPGGQFAHERVARTPADKPIVAAVGRKDQAGVIKVAYCGVAERPGLYEQDQLQELEPPDDFRGSSAYRREMAAILGKRVLEQLEK